ncbi:MAG: hypothetical protein M9922_02950 [Microthrixaceae bacterium]|nr:hypothetical protein [Microthrixaceae bacterium]
MSAAVVAVLLTATFQGATPAAAGDFDLTPTAEPPTPAFLAWAKTETEADTGAGTVSTGSSGNAITFAEESGYAFAGAEELRLAFFSYGFSYPARACAEYSLEYRMDITSDGPQVHNRFIAMFDSSGDPLFGEGGDAPAVGDTEEIGFDEPVSPADLSSGLVVNYGGLTGARDIPSGNTIGAGFTFGVPTVTVHEDATACPPPTTTTTTTTAPAKTTTTTTTTTTAPVGPGSLGVSDPFPVPGGTIVVSGSGFKPASEVRVSVAGTTAARTNADGAGSFRVSVKVPENASGSFEVVATGVDPNGNPKTDRTVVSVQGVQQQAVPPTSAPQSLTVTG